MRWDGQTQMVRVCRWPSSNYCANIMLRSPVRDDVALALLIEGALARGVKLIAVVGPGSLGTCIDVDKIVVGDEYDPSRFILTTSHETTLEAIEYIKVSRSSIRFAQVWL